MKLAPRMIQSMEILQLPVMELEERIEQELAENVCLILRQADPDAPETQHNREEAKESAAEKSLGEQTLQVDSEHNNEADFERLLEMSQDWPEDNYTSGSKPSSNTSKRKFGFFRSSWADVLVSPMTSAEGWLSPRADRNSFGDPESPNRRDRP